MLTISTDNEKEKTLFHKVITYEKKKNKKDQEIEALRAELEQQKELLVRTAAEFDNFKKRTEREKCGRNRSACQRALPEVYRPF